MSYIENRKASVAQLDAPSDWRPSTQSVKSAKGKQLESLNVMTSHVFMFALRCS